MEVNSYSPSLKRSNAERFLDRMWREIGTRMVIDMDFICESAASASSISCNMPWSAACDMFAAGKLESHDFRRLRAVKNVVETVCPSDARFYTKLVKE
jgi:hypothetical protein